MTHRHFKYEGWLYALAFLAAIAIRLIALGAMPLTDAEAAPALQALRLSQSARPALDPHPLYILSTYVLFLLFGGGTNFLARFVPALVGSLFVLAPLLFDDRIKPRPSLILAFFLVLDPGLVAISRQAASPMPAIAFLIFSIGFYNKNKTVHAAVAAALALLSGPSVWFGLLGIGITFAIAQFLPTSIHLSSLRRSSGQAFLPFIITLLLAGTLLFTVPSGLGAAFSSIPAFINSLRTLSDISQGMLTISLLVYQPFALILAVIALVRGWTRGLRRILYLSAWLLVSLLLAIFLPGRRMADLAWALIPLNALASLELARHFTIHPEERRETAGVVALTAFIWVFAWLGFAGINWLPAGTPEFNLRAGMLIGSALLLIVSLILVAAGWSIRIAQIGGVWGMALCLGVLSLGGMIGSTGIRGSSSPELWLLPNSPAQAELLRSTVSEISEIGRGNDYTASVTILGVNSPALEWTLRENPVHLADALDPSGNPDIVITSFETNPQLASAYRGQDFLWRQTPLWNLADTPAWLRWLSLRQMPQSQEIIILWARSDLFLDD